MFFLTTVAGLEPAAAGTVSAVGAVWNALCNPIAGYISDRVRTRFGRRRPMMVLFSIPMGISMLLLFTAVDFPEPLRPVYYGTMLVLFWTCFTGFFIPYSALGVQYTSDYEERTVLRFFASFFNMIGVMIAMVMPTAFVSMLREAGLTIQEAWSATGGTLGVIAMVTIIITAAVSAKQDPPCALSREERKASHKERFSIAAIFKEYISIARMKPVKYLVAASMSSLICYTMIMSDMIYYLTYNQGLTSSEASVCLVVRAAMAIGFIPIVGKAVSATDKRETLIGAYAVGIAGMAALKAAGAEGVVVVVIYMILTVICCNIYWQIVPSIFYDICEYDKAENGRDRQGAILSFQGLVEAAAAGGGSWLLGVILQIGGFDGEAEIQSAEALGWIENATTWVPVIFLVLAAFAFYRYPITRKNYEELRERNDRS